MNKILVWHSQNLDLFKKLVNVFDGKLEEMFNDNWLINRSTGAVFATNLNIDALRNIERMHNAMGTNGLIEIEVITAMEVSL
jgi:hypothetical protein